MEALFLKILNLSISAIWVVLAVVLLRFAMPKAPKAVRVVLWGIVGLRLVWPFSIESILSLIPSAETVPPDIGMAKVPAIHSGVPVLNHSINPVLAETMAATPQYSMNPMQKLLVVGMVIWVMGMVAMALYALISWLVVRIRVREAMRERENIWLCDRVGSPFILGLFAPRVYLPSDMAAEDMPYVLAHEQAHIKRKDHLWKPLGFLLLTVHWFNPVLWLAYILLCRDIELACDEKVVKMLGEEGKKPYSEALIHCSAPRRMITACPVAFGETGVKARIQSVLHYKKPAFWIILVAVIACIAVAVCFLTDPKTEEPAQPTVQPTEKVRYTPPQLWVSDGENQEFRAVMGNYRWQEIADGRLEKGAETDVDLLAMEAQLPVVEIKSTLESNRYGKTVMLQFGLTPDTMSVTRYVFGDDHQWREPTDGEPFSTMELSEGKVLYVVHAVWMQHGEAYYAFVGDAHIPEYEDMDAAIPELREKYPQFFGLDPREGMTVYIMQTAYDTYSCLLYPTAMGVPSDAKLKMANKNAVNIQTMRTILYSYGVNRADVPIVPVNLSGAAYSVELTPQYQGELHWQFWDIKNNPWANIPHWQAELAVTEVTPTTLTVTVRNLGIGQYGTLMARGYYLWNMQEQDGGVAKKEETWNPPLVGDPVALPVGETVTITLDIGTDYGTLPKGEYRLFLQVQDDYENTPDIPEKYASINIFEFCADFTIE